MDDITPALLEALRKRFEENLGGSRRAAALLKTIQDAGAGYAEAERYAEEVGRALSGAFGAVLTADVLPDGRMYWNIADRVVRPLLEQDHKLVADAAVQVQAALNRAAGLGIRAQRAPLDTDRINGLLNKLCAAQDYDSVRWVLGEPVINYSMAVADETLRLNVAWQAGAGLSPRITRRAEAGACRWCLALAGVWDFDDAPEDVYRRHENCRCVVEYDPGDGRRQNAHTKRWTNAQQRDKIEERKNYGIRSLVSELSRSPKRLASFTPEQIVDELEKEGFEVKPLKQGSLKNIPFREGGGFKVNFEDGGLFQYHPASKSHHGGAYYKISTGKEGTRRYDTEGNELPASGKK